MPARKKKIALVIGAGAVKCAAALGIWKVLEEESIHFDMIVGCSGGSLYAAAMAMGFSLQECIENTKKLWNRSVTERRNWRALTSVLLPGVVKFDHRFSMMSDAPMLKSFRSVFGDRTFADTKTSLYVMATDFETGESIAQHEGQIVDALRASVAIPYIWSAWQHNGRLLIDGAASNPLPVDVPMREGAEIILALGFETPLPSRVKSISRYAFYINSLMTNNLMQANFAFHNAVHHAEIISIFPEFERPIRLFDTDQFPYVIEQGEKAMRAQLDYLKRLLEA
ncbi:MAG TPA: patatin-like phospholipase family protein [Anaerolineales bacterium]|nr:patatin-like phospholipase family protein [Anaerolineales bacterium]